MSISSYGLSESDFTELFKEKAAYTLELLQIFRGVAFSKKINLDDYTDKFVWDVFQDSIYTTEEAARKLQKERDPEAAKLDAIEFVSPSREEILAEVKEIKALLTNE
jgi:hypothetical protein